MFRFCILLYLSWFRILAGTAGKKICRAQNVGTDVIVCVYLFACLLAEYLSGLVDELNAESIQTRWTPLNKTLFSKKLKQKA